MPEPRSEPRSETERLRTLRGSGLLSEVPDPALDDAVRAAAAACGTRMAMLSLVGRRALLIKARHGLEAARAPREGSCCEHLVRSGAPLVVPDARGDERFQTHPLVSDGPGVRFYAGVPLRVEGQVLGALCVLDQAPRVLEELWLQALLGLGRLVEAILSARRGRGPPGERLAAAADAAHAAHAPGALEQASLLDLAQDPIVVRDLEGRVTFWNQAAEQFYGWSWPEVRGRLLHRMVDARLPEPYEQIMQRLTHEGSREVEAVHTLRGGRQADMQVRFLLIRDPDGAPWRVLTVFRDVSEQRRIEREHERMLTLKRAILTAVSYAIVSTDAEGRIRTINRAAERLLGYGREELVGRAGLELLHRPDELCERARALGRELGAEIAPGLPALVARTRRDGLPDEREWTWVRQDGQPVRVFVSLTALRDPDGAPSGYVAVARDLTRDRAAARALRESEERLGLVLETTSSFAFVKDPQLRYTFVNRAFADALGRSVQGILGRRNEELFPPALARRLAPQDLAALASQRGVSFEETVPLPDGPRTLLFSLVPLRDERGELRALHGMATDITERRRIEDALRLSEARHRAVLETAGIGIVTIDAAGLVDSFNPEAERMFGYAAPEVLGRPVTVLLPLPQVGGHQDPLERQLLAGETGAFGAVREVTCRRKDGTQFPAELSLSETILNGRPLFTGILRDISERRALEQAKDEFIATVSHELRTPLTSIRGSVGLLEAGALGAQPPEALEVLEIARHNADRLIRLVNDLLDLEKLQAGRMELELGPIQPRELVRLALAGVRGLSATSLSLITARIDCHTEVLGDLDRLVQVLVNLLGNAVKFSPPRSPIEVRVGLTRPGRVRFAVVDQGPGIPVALQPKLFHKFQQLDGSDARARGGTGLGLAICKAIVEQHGGEVGLISAPGEGSTFWFDVPVALRASAALRKRPTSGLRR